MRFTKYQKDYKTFVNIVTRILMSLKSNFEMLKSGKEFLNLGTNLEILKTDHWKVREKCS